MLKTVRGSIESSGRPLELWGIVICDGEFVMGICDGEFVMGIYDGDL